MSSATLPASRWTDAVLGPMRHITDPLADAVIGEIVASGEVNAVNGLMRALVENDQAPDTVLPPVVRDYLNTSATLPPWADPARIQAGERVFERFGPHIIATLFTYSLPFCYGYRKGVQVLWLTGRLYTNPTRRIVETAQMTIDCMKPGGLGPDGAGIRTTQKVRLMHAGVRRLVNQSLGWNPEWDAPINQEDMAGTLTSFSWVVLDGLRKLGFSLTEDDRESYLHTWNVVGHVLGIRDELLPADCDDAAALAAAIQRRQYAACPEGQAMTAALIKMLKEVLPGNLFDSVPEMLLVHYMGQGYAGLLGVSAAEFDPVLRIVVHGANLLKSAALQDCDLLPRVAELFSRKLMDALLWTGRGGLRPPFSIPSELRQVWGVNWTT